MEPYPGHILVQLYRTRGLKITAKSTCVAQLAKRPALDLRVRSSGPVLGPMLGMEPTYLKKNKNTLTANRKCPMYTMFFAWGLVPWSLTVSKPPSAQVSNPQHGCRQLSVASKRNGKFPSSPGHLHSLRKEAHKGGMACKWRRGMY